MAKRSQGAGIHDESSISKREARAHRVLDAAEVLILRWGFQKTTLEDISRQAGVAKGTVYLHWKTREELLRTLIRRERLEMAEDIKQQIKNDPMGATLRGILKYSTLALLKRPLMKAVLMQDMDVLGKLAPREQSVHVERLIGFTTYLELLREHGMVRTDLSLHAQVYMFSAIFMGFFFVSPLLPPEFTLPDEELAELMAETVHRTLEIGDSVPSDALQAISQSFMLYLERAAQTAQEQFQQEIQ